MIGKITPDRIGIVTTDNAVTIGSTGIVGVTSIQKWIPSDVLEVWWDGKNGTIEYNDGKPMVGITSLPSIYNQAKLDWQYEWDRCKAYGSSSHRYYRLLREVRNDLLKQSDWTQFSDSPLTDAKKDEWKTYRQALRDIPINQPTPTSGLENITWPTKPS